MPYNGPIIEPNPFIISIPPITYSILSGKSKGIIEYIDVKNIPLAIPLNARDVADSRIKLFFYSIRSKKESSTID